MTTEIWTDGACRNNPGPGGWGAVLRAGPVELRLWGGQPETTNNEMELMAAIEGLSQLTRPSSVVVYSDSSYVINGITNWIHGWKKRGWKTANKQPVKNAELFRRLDELVQRHEVRWQWVKGHSGDEGNELADLLANQGIDQFALKGEVGSDRQRIQRSQ